MVERPSLELQISAARRFQVRGPLAQRVRDSAERWTDSLGRSELPACCISVLALSPQHAGLGSGTQLALSIATGLNLFHGRPGMSAADLARLMRRGRRSAVGTYGFLQGGFIFEVGRRKEETIAPLNVRLPFPEAWRFVLARPVNQQGLSGSAERNAFTRLPSVPDDVRHTLMREIRTEMIPALKRQDLAAFGESVFRYGRMSGECFAAIQGGPYNGPHLTRLVQRIRAQGVRGVGQSSWGPTIFALASCQETAEALVRDLGRDQGSSQLDFVITSACNQGARSTRVAAHRTAIGNPISTRGDHEDLTTYL